MGLRQARDVDRGATLVEFAIVVPLLVVLLFGIVESARLITEFVTVRTAAREGARFATTVGDPAAPNYADCTGIMDAARSKAVIGDVSNVAVEWVGPSFNADCTSGNPAFEDIPSGTQITVRVTSEFRTVVPLLSAFFDGINLSSEQTRQIFKGRMEKS